MRNKYTNKFRSNHMQNLIFSPQNLIENTLADEEIQKRRKQSVRLFTKGEGGTANLSERKSPTLLKIHEAKRENPAFKQRIELEDSKKHTSDCKLMGCTIGG